MRGRTRRTTGSLLALGAMTLAAPRSAAASGEDWFLLHEHGGAAAIGMCFFDERTGLVGMDGGIWKTTDGGRSWSLVKPGTSTCTDIEFPLDDQTGYACWLDGTVSRTADGGASWTDSPVSAGGLHAIEFTAVTGIGYVAGDGGAVSKTCDGGAHWVLQGTPVIEDLHGLQFPRDATTGWACGGNGTIIRRSGVRIVCGTYTGDGADGRTVAGLGFAPALVMVKAATAEPLVMRSATMTGDASKIPAEAAAFSADRLQSLDADGFTLGADPGVNGSGTTYHYVAFEEVAGEMAVGRYTGNGVDGHSIKTVGFQPDYVIVWGAGASPAWQRVAGMPADTSLRFDAAPGSTANIRSFHSTGFTVGTGAGANGRGTKFHYAAWKAAAGRVAVGATAGDGSDDRPVAGMGLRPQAVLICAASNATVLRPESLVGDSSCRATAAANAADLVQAIEEDGVELGTGCNAAGTTYHSVSWGGTWSIQATPSSADLWGLRMLDESTGYAVGDGGRVWKTTDGGTAWSERIIEGASTLTSLAFPLDATTGWVAGRGGKIYRTTDGGAGWTQQTTPPGTRDLRAIRMLDEATGWAAGESSTVLRTRMPWMIGGRYKGDGQDARSISGLGFRPDVVIVHGYGTDPVIRTSTMTGDASRPIDGSGDLAITSNIIESLDADGFTVGTDERVNADGTRYFWTALRAGAEIAVGTYAGLPREQSITGVGFEPAFLMIVASGDVPAAVRFGDMTGDATFKMSAAPASSNRIQAFGPDGFEVGTNVVVNRRGWTYHYVAMKPLAAQIRMGSYAGDGADDRPIAGLGFRPEWVIVKGDTGEHGHHKMNCFGAREASFRFAAGSFGDCIQSLDSDGFNVGADAAVNDAGIEYFWMALSRNTLEQPARRPSVVRSGEEDPY